jgi:hypothetical protein
MIEPAFEIDTAVGVDRLKRSDLDHLSTFPSTHRMRHTPAFSEPVG